MKVERKSSEEGMIGQFPEWEDGKVVEVFTDDGSCGLYMMCSLTHMEGHSLISLENGRLWCLSIVHPFGDAARAIEVKGKFVEE